MKKALKITAALVAFAIIGFVLWFANGMLGNPMSDLLAKSAATSYLAEKYSGTDYVIENVGYSFKTGGYGASITSPSSVDTYFYLSIDMLGNVRNNSYANITSGWNTYTRLEEVYRQMCNAVFDNNFPYESHIDFGTLNTTEKDDEWDALGRPKSGIKISELILDKEYDVKELAQTAGQLCFYAESDDLSFDKAAEILLGIKETFDKAAVPFFAIDFVVQRPKSDEESKEPYDSSDEIHTTGFLYSDIYEPGLAQRIEQNHNALSAHYAEQDGKK